MGTTHAKAHKHMVSCSPVPSGDIANLKIDKPGGFQYLVGVQVSNTDHAACWRFVLPAGFLSANMVRVAVAGLAASAGNITIYLGSAALGEDYATASTTSVVKSSWFSTQNALVMFDITAEFNAVAAGGDVVSIHAVPSTADTIWFGPVTAIFSRTS